ncbi:hypothetical protein AYX15_07185 [Cryptococcus neoformans]|nr:hypothetical protein AYX15_07185 [Cryptococcus neoformans var. grubii]
MLEQLGMAARYQTITDENLWDDNGPI